MEYNLRTFSRVIVQLLNGGYEFKTFLEKRQGKQTVLLRHDVDMSPAMALTLGKLENRKGVRASFFFMLGGGTYDIFDSETGKIVRELKQMGHCVGLHIDERAMSDEKVIALAVLFLEQLLGTDRVVSFHRPSPAVLGKSFDAFTNAYDARFFSRDNYVADSRRNKDWPDKLERLVKQQATPIQLLLHPGWWFEGDVMDIYLHVRHRAEMKLKRYLMEDMSPFREALGNEAGDFRV